MNINTGMIQSIPIAPRNAIIDEKHVIYLNRRSMLRQMVGEIKKPPRGK